jgi:hypothetical protein
MLKNFQVDQRRDLLVPSISLYQLDLSEPVMQSAAAGEFDDEDMRLLPSWSKFAAHPQKSKGFFVRMLESVFLGKHGVDPANVDLQTQNWFGREKSKVAMMFVSGGTRVKDGNLATIGVIAQSALPAWRILVLGGGTNEIDGRKVKNANAEALVREQVQAAKKLNQSVLIISALMAQRSFSIPEITELYLAYDSGEAGATIQKMSRALTPGAVDKVGKIISLSFDPNRDDKFDSMLLETTFNLAKRAESKSAAEAMMEVLATIDIFSGTAHGSVKVDKDSYLTQVLARKSVSRVIGSTADLSKLHKDVIQALARGTVDYIRADKVAAAPKGKTKLLPKKPSKEPPSDRKVEDIRKARERITAIVDNIDLIRDGTGCNRLMDAIKQVDQVPEVQECIEQEFGVAWSVVKDLFDKGVIKYQWLELIYDKV